MTRSPIELSWTANKGGKVGIFDLGACEVARSLQARLAGSHGFYNRALDGGRCRGSFIKKIHHANEGPISEHDL